jgi:hypothetical protein
MVLELVRPRADRDLVIMSRSMIMGWDQMSPPNQRMRAGPDRLDNALAGGIVAVQAL